MDEKTFVSYEQFGAVGDGVANDFPAMYAAHLYANEHHLDVRADSAKTYRIGDTRLDGAVKTIPILTNVHWGEAKFIIDDTDMLKPENADMMKKNIFEVLSDYEVQIIEDPAVLAKVVGLGPDTKKVDLALGYPALIVPMDEDNRVYKRRGSSYYNGGSIKHEVVLIDAEGNIDESTPLMFTYDHLTRIKVYRTDMPRLLIEGGAFTTAAPQDNIFVYDSEGRYIIRGGYVERGMIVRRSYTTVRNVKHYVINEISVQKQIESNFRWGGAYYSGFFHADNATDVTFEGCVLTGKRCYRTPEGLTNYNGHMGTYDFSAYAVNKIVLMDCDQCNFYVNKYTAAPCEETDPDAALSTDSIPGGGSLMCWGIGGTNFCKNMEYIRCRLSRFDAHCGLYHGKVIDSTVNCISMVGNGNMIVENTRFISAGKGGVHNSFLYMRDDYGATWNGDILVKNCTAETKEDYLYMTNVTWANWDYGYRCYMPSLTIDNFVLKAKPETKLEIVNRSAVGEHPDMHLPVLADGTKNDNPVVPARYLRVVNNHTNQLFHLIDSPVYDATEIVGNIVKD